MEVRTLLLEYFDESENEDLSVASLPSGRRGRPFLNIPAESLDHLLEQHFSVPDIAKIMCVSVRTIRNRMTLYDLQVNSYYSELTEEQLDGQIQDILECFPNSGYKQMLGHLRAKGLRVRIMRVRESMRRVDPIGILNRSLHLRIIKRRKYSVAGPNALWHIDGNHKLIR